MKVAAVVLFALLICAPRPSWARLYLASHPSMVPVCEEKLQLFC